MEKRCWQFWRDEYYTPSKVNTIAQPERHHHIMEAFLLDTHYVEKVDEFNDYINRAPVPISDVKGFNPITWWHSSQKDYPTLFQYALDTLAIPATATECERTFSSAKKLVTPERNRLADDVVEACECLKAWWDCGVIKPRY